MDESIPSIPPLLRQETIGPGEFGSITSGTPVNGQSIPEFVPLPNGLWGWDKLMELEMDEGWYDDIAYSSSGDEYEHEDLSDSESDSGEDMEVTDDETESVDVGAGTATM